MKRSMNFRGLTLLAGWLMLTLLGLTNRALAELPPLKLPVASYDAERSLGGFLSGGKFVSMPEGADTWLYKYKSFVLGEDYLLQTPTLFQFSSTTEQTIMPLGGGKMVRGQWVHDPNYPNFHTLRVTTHEAGLEAVLTTRNVHGVYPYELKAACSGYALAYNSVEKKLAFIPFAEGDPTAELDLSSVIGSGVNVSNVVAGGNWFAVATNVSGSWQRFDWRIYRASDFELIGAFQCEIAASSWSAFVIDGRYIAVSEVAQIQLWDTENLNAEAKAITAVQAGSTQFEEVVGDGASLWAVVGGDVRAKRRVSQLVRNATSGNLEVGYQAELDITRSESVGMGLAAEGSIALFRNSATGATRVYDSRVTPLPIVEMIPDEAAEESSGIASFQVSLDEPAREACSVRVIVRSGTATAGADFVARDFRLEFSPGERTKRVEVTLLPDVLPENHESILVDLLEPEGLLVRPTENTNLVIRASGFQSDQQVFAGLPEGWGKHDVLAVLTNYVIARVQRPSPSDPYQTEYKIAAFDLKDGGFVSFADFDTNQKTRWSEADGQVGYLSVLNSLNDSILYRWNPRNGSAYETRQYNHYGYGVTSAPVWAGGNRVVAVKRDDYDVSAAPGGLGLFLLDGTKVSGVNPWRCEFALSSKYLAVVAYYNANPSSDYWKSDRLWAHVYDRATLTRLWSKEIGATQNTQFSVQISNDKVLVADHRLMAFEASNGNLLWTRMPHAKADTGSGGYTVGLSAIGPKHAFVPSQSGDYRSLDVIELETGAYLGQLEVGDLFRPVSTVESIIGSGNGVFVERSSRNTGDSDLIGNTWVELKADRTRPAVIMDPAVLATSNGGTPVSFRLVEPSATSVEIELFNQVYMAGMIDNPGSMKLTVPATGSVNAWLDMPPTSFDQMIKLAGRILENGQIVEEEIGRFPAFNAVRTLDRDAQIQLAAGFDFTGARSITVGDGLIFVAFPFDQSGGVAGTGKIEVFDADTGVNRATIRRPAKPVCYEFGRELLYHQGRLLVGAPGVPPLASPTKKYGCACVFEAATGRLLSTITNPSSGTRFGSALAASPQYFAVSALNPQVANSKGGGSVTVFRWDNFKKVFSKTGDPYMGTSLAFAGDELLVGTPGAIVKERKIWVVKAGVVQSLTFPKGKAGPNWVSPWFPGDRAFGGKLLQTKDAFVVAPETTTFESGYFQVFDGVRGSPRFMFMPWGGFRVADAAIHKNELVLFNGGSVVLVSLADGSVSMETYVDSAPYCAAFDSDSNLYWLDDGHLYRADRADLGGFVWWSRYSLPEGAPAEATGDANHNGQADLVDYVFARAGSTPVQASSTSTELSVTVADSIPKDVSVAIEVADTEGSWHRAGEWAGGYWASDDLSAGVPIRPLWKQPIEYRVVYQWLGRSD